MCRTFFKWFAIGLVIFLILGGISTGLFFAQKDGKDTDRRDWQAYCHAYDNLNEHEQETFLYTLHVFEMETYDNTHRKFVQKCVNGEW